MAKKPWIVEGEGSNDSRPYQVDAFGSLTKAYEVLAVLRNSNPRTRYRLIKVVEDFA